MIVDPRRRVDITYVKPINDSGSITRFDSSDRTIIPTVVPGNNIKALDVTDLSADDVSTMENQYNEYSQYFEAMSKNLFSFEDWLNITYGDGSSDNVKWRNFAVDRVTVR